MKRPDILHFSPFNKKYPYVSLTNNGPPRINIAVVGDKGCGKTEIIKTWLNILPTSVIISDTYNKIVWIDNQPVHIKIREISNETRHNWLSMDQFIKYDTIVFVYDTSDPSEIKLNQWINNMKDKLITGGYEVIVGLSKKEISEQDLISAQQLKNYYAGQKINYYIASLLHDNASIENLKKVTNTITSESYYQMKSITENTIDEQFELNDIYKDLYSDNSSINSDNKELPLLNKKKNNYGCCVIL